MKKELVIPTTPYIFQSGKHAGESVESFIFKGSEYLFHVRNRKHRENDVLDQHLDFIFEAGCELETKLLCPFCQEKKVKNFLVLNKQFLTGLTCCDNPECRRQLKNLHPGYDLRIFRISTLGEFKIPSIRKKAETFFRKVYGYPRKATPEKILDMLRRSITKEDLQPFPLTPPRSRFKVKSDAVQTKLSL
jgi:hypothetical protein